MTGNIPENPLPDSESDEELANNFTDFFIHKIQKIRDSLEHHPKYDPRESTTRPKEMLSQFREVSEDEVKKIINRMATISCESDPIPTSTKADLTSSHVRHNKNNEHVTEGRKFCLKLEDCHCQASPEKK